MASEPDTAAAFPSSYMQCRLHSADACGCTSKLVGASQDIARDSGHKLEAMQWVAAAAAV